MRYWDGGLMEQIKAYVERYAITRMRGRNRRLIDGKHETPPEQIERLEKSVLFGS